MRFRFSIRDLLWLTIVVALGVAWWLDHKAGAAKLDIANQKLSEAKLETGLRQWEESKWGYRSGLPRQQ